MSGELSTQAISASEHRGLMLTTLDEMWRFATCLAKSGLAPKGMDKPEALVVALQIGAELGLSPMASIQNVAVINGRPSLWGDAMLAVCQGRGDFDHSAFDETIEEGDKGIVATCTVRRLPSGKPVKRSFSMADAKLAGLSGKTGPWAQYPKRMCQMRARSWALRDAFSDALRGIVAREEAMDIPPDRVIDTKPIVRKLPKPATAPEMPVDEREAAEVTIETVEAADASTSERSD